MDNLTNNGKLDRVGANSRLSRSEFLKRGGVALAGVVGAGALAGFSPFTQSASAQYGWPGVRYYLDPILPPVNLNYPPPQGAVIPQEFRGLEDQIMMYISDGAYESPPLQPNETLIEFTRKVDWDKRIELMLGGSPTGVRLWATKASEWWNLGATMRLCTPDTPNPGPNVRRADTIVFTKPKEFGRWYYMYNVDPVQFWHLFGGKRVKFYWIHDDCSCGFGFLAQHPAKVFRTGFEEASSDFQPDWWFGTPEPSKRNVRNPVCQSSAGKEFEVPPPAHIGSNLLSYGGYVYSFASRDNYPRCYFKVFDVNLNIHSDTWLIYWIHPTTNLGRYVGVDFVCTNGETLRNSGAVDWRSGSMAPSAGHRVRNPEGGFSELPLSEWTPIACHVGEWLAGRTIDRVLVSFQLPRSLVGTTGRFEGDIDTIFLGELPNGDLGRIGPTIISKSS